MEAMIEYLYSEVALLREMFEQYRKDKRGFDMLVAYYDSIKLEVDDFYFVAERDNMGEVVTLRAMVERIGAEIYSEHLKKRLFRY